MTSDSLATPARALAIGAHPDDIEFQCGGTLAKWAADGCELHLLILTDGAKGSWEENIDRDLLVETRKREAQTAGGALGATQVHFLNFIDGELESTLVNRGAVCRVIRDTRPEIVLGHDPWKRYRLHPDHRHAGFLTVDGVVAARDPHFFRDSGVAHHRPEALLLFEADEPDHWEPLEDEHVQAKITALLLHESQLRSTMGIDADPDAEREAFIRSTAEDARGAGLAAGPSRSFTYAEAFRRLATA